VCVMIVAMTSLKGSVTWPKSSSHFGSLTCMVSLRVHRSEELFYNGPQEG